MYMSKKITGGGWPWSNTPTQQNTEQNSKSMFSSFGNFLKIFSKSSNDKTGAADPKLNPTTTTNPNPPIVGGKRKSRKTKKAKKSKKSKTSKSKK
jgi:hypothetical protein